MSQDASFCLTIKVNGEIKNLNINVSDTKSVILKKLSIFYPDCFTYPNQYIGRIKSQLQALTYSKNTKKQLKQMIQVFINNFDDQEDVKTECQFTQLPFQSRAKTCFSQIFTPVRKSKNRETQTQFSPKKVYIQSKNSINVNNLEQKNINLSKNRTNQKKNMKNNQQNNPAVKKNVNKRKKVCNPDIVKACETIMKKNTQNQMKIMAKQFLKEKGYLKVEKQPILRKKTLKSEASQPKKQLNPQVSQHKQSKQKQRSVVSREVPNRRPSREQYLSTQPSVNINKRNTSSITRFKYLNTSIDNLNNKYSQMSPISQIDKSSCQRKYKYLDD